MNHLLYLAGSLAFLFGFFYFSSYASDNRAFVYLQWACLVMSFWILTMGIAYWSSKKAPSMTYREKQDVRLNKWHEQKSERRKRRRL